MRSSRQDIHEAFGSLLAIPRGEPVVLLHSCGAGPARLLHDPVDAMTLPAGAERGAWSRVAAFLERHRGEMCAGFFGYDLRDDVEPLPRRAPPAMPLPVLHLAAFRRWREWPAARVPAAPEAGSAVGVRPALGRADYEARVAAIVERIRAGDVFQANFTQPFTGRFEGDPRRLFWRGCEVTPAPFAAYLETGTGLAVLSFSPEEFLRREGDRVRTRPIKGTRPRGRNPKDDRCRRSELLASEKDRAELAMIVDLMRNDLGKVARPGSVRVRSFPELESFAQVHHLVATVEADLREGVSAVDLLRATFPAGSITGAPKLAAMEILEELEVARRGVYTGAIGWIGPEARLHLNVAIRTMVVADGMVRFDAGGGVTADSDPAAEYEECLAKASGMLRTLGVQEVEDH